MKTAKKLNKFSSNNIKRYLKGKKMIFDVGSGPNGSYWWKSIDEDARIVGIDNIFFPTKLLKNVKLYKMDANLLDDVQNSFAAMRYRPFIRRYLKERVKWVDEFDMVVANHVLEHVESPEKVIKGISKLIKRRGIVYTGFPDSRNFTDIFYHLVHAEGGGHIQKLTDKFIEKIFENNGFRLIEKNIWPDDWFWFEKLYDYKARGVKYIDKKEIEYLVRVFREELTVEKGYFYGWELVFEKR
jgi:SAM-dependent methyltransferase